MAAAAWERTPLSEWHKDIPHRQYCSHVC
jgi:hypothetical protein